MNIERLRNIILFSAYKRWDINKLVNDFYLISGTDEDCNYKYVMMIARHVFKKRGYRLFEMPLNDDEIGALSFVGDGLNYVVLNSSLPQVNENFALAHEIYHIFYGEKKASSKVEFSSDHYYEHEEESAANLFAGTLLMPELIFRRMFITVEFEKPKDLIETIVHLMCIFNVPYMAVLIRCLELGLIPFAAVNEEVLSVDRDGIKKRMRELWLDYRIMDPSLIDDYPHIESDVEQLGKEYVEEEYINQRTLDKVLRNMKELHKEIERK